jgi:hypothetical protein
MLGSEEAAGGDLLFETITCCWEPVVVFYKGSARYRSEFARACNWFFSKSHFDDLARVHPCPKPLDQCEELIRSFTFWMVRSIFARSAAETSAGQSRTVHKYSSRMGRTSLTFEAAIMAGTGPRGRAGGVGWPAKKINAPAPLPP